MEHQSFNRTEPIPQEVQDYFVKQQEETIGQFVMRKAEEYGKD